MTSTNTIIAPSILSADFSKLAEEVKSVEPYAEWLQIDVMDGHFVPNLSFGAPVMKWIKTSMLLDVHLMVSNPIDRIDEFIKAGAKHITFHAEAVQDTDARKALIQAIRGKGATAGIALKPHTPLAEIDDVIDDVDLAMIMSVDPGFGGQDFIPDVLDKVKQLRQNHAPLMIQMDGGIDDKTAALCREAGANNLVAGSYIFRSKDRQKAIDSLRK